MPDGMVNQLFVVQIARMAFVYRGKNVMMATMMVKTVVQSSVRLNLAGHVIVLMFKMF